MRVEIPRKKEYTPLRFSNKEFYQSQQVPTPTQSLTDRNLPITPKNLYGQISDHNRYPNNGQNNS
jgi:hypothetical protein